MKIIYDGVEFDSNEEVEFYQWMIEARAFGLIKGTILSQPPHYKLSPKQVVKRIKQLKTKTKLVDKFLLHPHKYTADFLFMLTQKGVDSMLPFEAYSDDDGGYTVVVDVKGGFNLHGGDRGFAINQKWVYQQYGIFVNKVVPEKLFKATWCPALARLTPKTCKPRAKYLKCKTITEYLSES